MKHIRITSESVSRRNNKLLARAVVLLKRKRPKQALRFLLQAKAKSKHNGLIYYNLGLAYEAVKRYRDAMRCYRRALFYEPSLLDAAVCLGYLYGLKGNVKRELACYDEVLKRDTKHMISLYNKAVVLDDKLDNQRAAIPLYLQVLKQTLTRDQRRDVYMRLAYAYLDMRQYGKAIKSLRNLMND